MLSQYPTSTVGPGHSHGMLARALAPNTSASYDGKVQPSLQPVRTNTNTTGESQHAYYILSSIAHTVYV